MVHSAVTGFRQSLAIWSCGLYWLCAGLVTAQETGPGTVSFRPRWDAVRTQAPMFYEAYLEWPLPNLLTGELQVESYRDRTLLERWISHETVLSNVGQSLSLTLPYPQLATEQQTYSLRANFVSPNRSIYLDEHILLPYARWRRVSVIGIIEDRDGAIPAGMIVTGGATEEFYKSLLLEPWFPVGRDEEEATLLRGWIRRTLPVPPAHVPAEPLQLLAFDSLYLSTDQLAKLSEAQREALLIWTRGGGSLAVSVAGAVPRQWANWLNLVAGGSAWDPKLIVTEQGKVELLQTESGGVWLGYPGYGRSALILQAPEVQSQEWHEVVLHLWKVRDRQREHVLGNQEATVPFRFDRRADDWTIRDSLEPLPWEPQGVVDAGVLTGLLLPESVSGVPLWLVCSVLGACFLLAVPGDYWLLGALRLRRWTWVCMPLVALGSTWYMVRTANSYLGNQDYRQSLTFMDLDRSGQVLRCNQFELNFPATSRLDQEPGGRVIRTDLGEGQTGQREIRGIDLDPDRLTRQQFRDAAAGLLNRGLAPTDIPVYVGTIPGDYLLQRRMNQWTPRITRSIGFQPLADQDVTWCNGQVDDLQAAAVRLYGLASEKFARVELLSWKAGVRQLWWNGRWSADQRQIDAYLSQLDGRFRQVLDYAVQQTDRRNERGLFRIVSQVSPQGVTVTEDLALDLQREAFLLLTVNEDQSEFVAWRMQ